jgi:MSHA pilin protein MshD
MLAKKNDIKIHKGFTLIEMIVGMVLLSLALVALSSFLFNRSSSNIDPIWQTRAIGIAQSVSNEILAKDFDENTSPSGAGQRCSENLACTTGVNLGAEVGEVLLDYDDVDDYNGLNLGSAQLNSLVGASLLPSGDNTYEGFNVAISVFYDGNLDGIDDNDVDGNGVQDAIAVIANIKTIHLTVSTPDNESLEFVTSRANY